MTSPHPSSLYPCVSIAYNDSPGFAAESYRIMNRLASQSGKRYLSPRYQSAISRNNESMSRENRPCRGTVLPY
jgi:hypothetical protein